MGLISAIFGNPGTVQAVAGGVAQVAEVFTPSATRRMELSAEAQTAALAQMGAEYQVPPQGGFDRFVNGLNRLPRPLLAFGTIGLFAYAMVDPLSFARRMIGLNAVPEPLWWLLGAVVAFYFGARETHYFRNRAVAIPSELTAPTPRQDPEIPAPIAPLGGDEDNPALAEWRATRR